MSLQHSTTVRNDWLDRWEVVVGTSAVIKMWTGSQPSSCSAANSGTELASFSLPSDYMAAASSGSKAKTGSWPTPSGLAAGNAGHFRVYASDGTTCHMQGTITATGGGGDMTIDNIVIAVSQVITITGFTLTAPGA